MNDREAFIAKIIEDPDSDTPRLVLADWLDEHDEPERAEFIRVQCELHPAVGVIGGMCSCCGAMIASKEMREIGHYADCRLKYLRSRERDLLKSGHADWSPTAAASFIPRLSGHPLRVNHALYRRGFVETISCTWADWLAHHEQILAQTPLKNVELTTRPDWEAIDRNGVIQFVGRSFDIRELAMSGDSITEAIVSKIWPRLKFTFPPIAWPVGAILPPHPWTVRGTVPTYVEIDEAQRLFQSSTISRSSMPHYLYYGSGPTPSSVAAPPEPPADPSSDGENI